MPFKIFRNFIKLEAASAIILFTATLLALILANSPLYNLYSLILHTPIALSLKDLKLTASPLSIINDGLMTIFFFLVSLEIKRELIEGELSTRSKAILPIIAAIGGIALPAMIYHALNYDLPENIPGWAIPTATDIAFSLGILALAGSRVPASLKIFLTALAIIDDLGAIIIIAIFYTDNLILVALACAAVAFLILLLLNYFNVNRFWPYALVGFILWLCILKSGIHATIAGVLVALTIPLHTNKDSTHSFLHQIEHTLHPWVAYGILPLFAFANAGLSLSNIQWATLFTPLPLGIIAGLFIGKQLGIFGASWLAIKYGFAKLPSKVSWRQFYGITIICGIGFTMSLFIGTLAFSNDETVALVRLGVFAGSLLSGLAGYMLLRLPRR